MLAVTAVVCSTSCDTRSAGETGDVALAAGGGGGTLVSSAMRASATAAEVLPRSRFRRHRSANKFRTPPSSCQLLGWSTGVGQSVFHRQLHLHVCSFQSARRLLSFGRWARLSSPLCAQLTTRHTTHCRQSASCRAPLAACNTHDTACCTQKPSLSTACGMQGAVRNMIKPILHPTTFGH